jgi:hypothetical protein
MKSKVLARKNVKCSIAAHIVEEIVLSVVLMAGKMVVVQEDTVEILLKTPIYSVLKIGD